MEETKPPVPASEEHLAGLALPPRPNIAAQPAPSEGSATGVDQKTELPPTNGKDEPIAADAPKKPEVLAAEAPAPSTEEAVKKEKKSTFQFVRDFFKPVPTEPR